MMKLPMNIKICDEKIEDPERRCTEDLLYVYNSKMYINEKGYLTKLIDLLYELDYYKYNESLFLR